jgi:hypothetical protein
VATYKIKGSQAKVTLTDNDFVARGGEKQLFAKCGTAYCIYHDSRNAIPPGKIRELSQLATDEVVVPTAELLDARNQHVGEVMKFVDDSYSPFPPNVKPMVLCQLFTNAFRRKQKIENHHITEVSNRLLSITRHCHNKGAVLVDPNETNWLVRHDLRGVYLIDTSCIQTASYPGTAIKPAIRDWTVNHFDVYTDWFSVAVVLGWLWVGIHPYLAFHPKWKGIPDDQALIPRMKEHWSFFRQGTEFNRACRPIDEIPTALRDWLHETLDGGMRCEGPLDCGRPSIQVSVVQKPSAPISSATVELKLCRKYEDYEGVMTATPQLAVPVRAWNQDGNLHLENLRAKQEIPISCRSTAVFLSGDTIYSVGQTTVSEIVFNEPNGTVRATVRKVGSIADLPTTRTYQGCVIQNLLGKYLLSIFPEPGRCVQRQIPELIGWQILDAKYESGVLVIAAEQSGNYQMLMRKFDFEAGADTTTQISTKPGDVNFAVTVPSGIAAVMLPDGNLLITSNKPTHTKTKLVKFPEPDMELLHIDNRIVGVLGDMMYDIILK